MDILDGKKTHLVVLIYLLCCAAEGLLGFDVPNFDLPDEWLGPVLAALGVSTIRDALRKVTL